MVTMMTNKLAYFVVFRIGRFLPILDDGPNKSNLMPLRQFLLQFVCGHMLSIPA